jgi:signal transduction histidine kinase/pSer/pThr/pTyr-binding forkhead associated (FHA) protein
VIAGRAIAGFSQGSSGTPAGKAAFGVETVPSLFVFRGNNQGMRFELETEVLSLGRESSNDIQLHDTEVSRRHAELRRTDKTFTVTDLNSSNGTYVNGKRVQGHQLANGDEVQMGGTVMLYTCLGDESTGDLADKIDIIARHQPGDRSRIVRSMSQAEGSRILADDSAAAASPWLARARSNLQVMYRTALAVSHTLDIDQLLNRIMQLIFEWVEADRGCIMLVDPDTGKLEPKVRRNRKGVKSEDRITISKTILDYVMEHNEGVLTSNASEDDRWNPAASILQLGICEAICAPMQGRYNMVGVIYIDTSISPQRVIQQQEAAKFTEEHLKLMIAIAHQAALAVEDTRYYSAMVQAERLAAVGQTIATLSHHIKNILQGIRGGSFLIKEGLSQHDESMVGKGWEFVEKNQERISNLVMDMLTFSKEREPELVPSDMNEVAADVVELMTSRARDKHVELRFVPASPLPTLTFDPEGLHRAILNVVTNAIDACEPDACEPEACEPEASEGEQAETPSPRPGLVEVRVEYHAAEALVRIVISDNGSGIPPEEIEQIFSLFVSHKGSRGTGIGLPVSQKIIKEHGGRIFVDSKVGKGSRFTLEIPAVLSEGSTPSAKLDGKTLV